tara:strand:- start:9765 stop:11597 length:1833 start_codon:yes stop_codon:yes gene_type:complete
LKPLQILILTVFFFSINILIGQETEIDKLISSKKYSAAEKIALDDLIKDKDSSVYFSRMASLHLKQDHLDLAISHIKFVDSTSLKSKDLAVYYETLADIFWYIDLVDASDKYFKQAQKEYYKISDSIKANLMNLELHSVNRSIQRQKNYDDSYLFKFYDNAKRKNDTNSLFRAHIRMSLFYHTNTDSSLYHLNKAMKLATIMRDSIKISNTHNSYAFRLRFQHSYKDSVDYHHDKSIEIALKIKNYSRLQRYLFQKAITEGYRGKYSEAIRLLKLSDTISLRQNRIDAKQALYRTLSINYKRINNRDSAYYYLQESLKYKDSLRFETYNPDRAQLIQKELNRENDLRKLYEEEKKRIITIIGITLLVIGLIIVFTYFKLKHKRALAEKEREILLTNEKLSSIDAVLLGQKNERNRIANELHDSLGSLLATIKLYVQNLKISNERANKQQNEIILKTEVLLDEAYDKIRTVAHKNSKGQLLRDGLLPAMKNFASKISETKRILIEIFEDGFSKRLSNDYELVIFRIYQELLTNIIKHASASKAIVHINQDKTHITLMIEDDGKGFNYEGLSLVKGMGLKSIKNRVEKYQGEMTIDSHKNFGTTIIVKLPNQ